MCRFREASLACSVAARRAEYTAREASKLAAGIEETNTQVIREATELVDEWVLVREGLAVAEEVCTLISRHPEAFDEFRRSIGSLPPVAARKVPYSSTPTRTVGATVADAIRAVRAR